MKRFIYKTLLLLLPLFLLSYPLDIFISNGLKKSHGYAGEIEVMSDIYDGKANCDIAIYGSSRAWVHINPQILNDSLGLSAYNFGIDGHNFWLEYLRHLAILKYNKKPSQIIVAADPNSLKKRKDLYQMEQFLPFMLFDKDIREYTSSYIGFNTLDYYIPLIRYFGQSKVLSKSIAFRKNKNPQYRYRKRGFAGQNRTWDPEMEKILKWRFHHKIEKESIDLFDRFLSECADLDIEVILVHVPEYIEGQKIITNRDEILSVFSDFAEKYGLLFIDYSDNEICLDKNNFYNPGHLNKDGANLFTSILAHDLRIHAQNTSH